MLESVVNLSEGRDARLLGLLAEAAGPALLDRHADPDHHRAVLTLAGDEVESRVRAVCRAAVALLDLRAHAGAHPRLGVVDVVPFVHLEDGPAGVRDGDIGAAVAARDRFAAWAGAELGLPVFCYGPERSLPEVRRRAWRDLGPDAGPQRPHPSAGAVCAGARPCLVAYNLWLAEPDLRLARRVAAEVRSPALRTLGLAVGERVQVSCNLIDPWSLGPAAAFDAVAARAAVASAELVGLLPRSVLDAVPAGRQADLDLSPSRTIEARRRAAGLDGGRSVDGGGLR